MAAAGVGPQSAGVVFPGGASMQQDAAVSIADDDGYGAVSQPASVRLELGGRSDLAIVGVDDDHVIRTIVDAWPRIYRAWRIERERLLGHLHVENFLRHGTQRIGSLCILPSGPSPSNERHWRPPLGKSLYL
jgi:hypothetical protein